MIKQTKEELLDCIRNLMGVLDTPVGRQRIKGLVPDEARRIGREILLRNQYTGYTILDKESMEMNNKLA